MERAAINRPAKLGRRSSSETPSRKSEVKTKARGSRNPLKELNGGYLPPVHSREGGPRRGCFGRLLSNSSSSSSSSSSRANILPKSRPLPRTPTSAPPNSRAVRCLKSSVDARKNQSRPSFEVQKHSASDRNQRPAAAVTLQRWNRGKLGGLSAAAIGKGKPTNEPKWELLRHGRERPAAISHVCAGLGADLEKSGTPMSLCKISYGSGSDDPAGEEGDQSQIQNSQTPTSTRTATPPVQATISPEFGGQSMLPTPACFAAGHLLTGVQDRRKCRPRGILNGGSSGLHIADSGSLGFHVCSSAKSQASLTPPPPLVASVRWLSSPGNGQSGRLEEVSSSNSRLCLAEASVSWFLSPKENLAGKSTLQNFSPNSNNLGSSGTTPWSNHHLLGVSPASLTETACNSPELRGWLTPSSSNFEKTPPALEICRSPASSSGLSPFSMILQKASAISKFKDHSPQDKGRCHYLSSAVNSPFSGDSHGNSNVMCTPSSCSSPSRQVGQLDPFGLHPMAEEAVGNLCSSPPHQELSSGGSKPALPFSTQSFHFGCPPTPLNSVDLSCFQRPSCLQSSAKVKPQFRGENSSPSEMRISWREGLISRIFDMHEFTHSFWSPEKEDGGCQEENQLTSELDRKLECTPGSSKFTKVNELNAALGFGSFEFSGYEQQREQNSGGEGPFPSPTPCAESLQIDEHCLMASDDSDWTLFFKNHLFEV
ncbi:unnamed protein product [Spirodela intermedia]|uniref:Uncharacterized protein n=1 Tax=Spirodela intermedia TaxID=51605 RepID=A0A7I8KRE2_SPIIN|nr:unnamed protein product [Spirodela intermedia]